MLIECDSCRVRGLGCGECVVAELFGEPALDAAERRALTVLAEAGMITPEQLERDSWRQVATRAERAS
jgi:hypothetical protein